uniref:Reverse transcriptase domain-containing protein n=1 Tax=Cannabis sativa TaxID=3483 RepID=A0A803QHW9_CANSA
MIVLRLKEALPLVISETQSAFLSNITDNILVAFELVHHIQHRTRGGKSYSALKLDMSKAFDRVEWTFLWAVMEKMGFASNWIALIQNCLTSSSLSFSLNGEVTGYVKPSRGLRQGDPLSPYHFLIGSEGLSRLLQHEEAIGNLQGLRLTRRAPSVSHLLFADDSLLFCETTNNSALAIERALNLYHRASDRLIWHHTTSRIYAVKSGFHLAATLDEQQEASASDLNSKWWKSFWHLKLPSKIKIFAWKVIYSAIPIAAALHRRKVIDSVACSTCSNAWESIGHALFTCPHAKSTWKHSDFTMDFRKAQAMHDGDFIFHLSNVHSQPDFELNVCTMWAIWSHRNKVLHGGVLKEGKITTSFAQDYLGKYHASTRQTHTAPAVTSVSPTGAHTSKKQASKDISWQPPTAAGLKLNVDAAVNATSQTLGVGAIVRDHNGLVVAAISKPAQGCFHSDEMEAKALFHSLNWALQQQLQITHIETDSLRVFNALIHTSIDLSCFLDLIIDVCCLLSFFPEATISHVMRNANHVAHGLAKHALELDQDFCWVGEIPYHIFTTVVNDS